MADVRPFRGVRYDVSRAGLLDKLLSPPYDVVTPDAQRRLYETSPYNVIRVELNAISPGDSARDNPYTRAAATLSDWLHQGVLVQDKTPRLYAATHGFEHEGRRLERRELTMALKLEEWSAGVVRPHEGTAKGPKEDRLALMRATKASISPIMLLYRDLDHRVRRVLSALEEREPLAQVSEFQGESFSFWATDDAELVSTVCAALADRPVYIADGHHRYETALEYLAWARTEGEVGETDIAASYVLATLIDVEDTGLLSLPYHRVLSGLSDGEREGVRRCLEQTFTVDVVPVDAGAMGQALFPPAGAGPGGPLIAVAGLEEGKLHILSVGDGETIKRVLPDRSVVWRGLAPCVFAGVILPLGLGISQPEAEEQGRIDYLHDATEAVQRVQEGSADLAFLLAAVPVTPLTAVADAGERLPRKSTYFHPKLPTGLVMKSLQGPL